MEEIKAVKQRCADLNAKAEKAQQTATEQKLLADEVTHKLQTVCS